jgi:acyl-CoA reductase-like NAD-dependent aldehyde dehydrogenase
VKASEHASAALLEFGRLIEMAGIPDGVVNIITGHGEPCGRELTSHPLIAKIAFTGGPAAARHVVRNSANNLAPLTLELGGKSPVIVFDDADIETSVNGALSAIFGATGQSCVAGSRLYLHETIADQVLEQMAAKAKKIRVGDPLDEDTEVGPICTLAQTERIENEIAHALKEGATLICGGKPHQHLGGNYFEPTIIECPRQDLRIVDTELFGPVLSVLRFKDEEEVLRLANDSEHGLAAGVFTTNGARALRASRELKAGIIWINTYRAVSPIAEAGGMKMSGYGRESGFQAIYDYTQTKTVWINTSGDSLGSQFVAR